MRNKRQSIDGFVVRKQPQISVKPSKSAVRSQKKKSAEGYRPKKQPVSANFDVNKLAPIDVPVSSKKEPKFRPKKKKSWLKRIILLVLILLLLGGAFIGYRFIKATNSIFNGNWLNIFNQVEMKKDANNRTNLLLFGTEEDSERGADQGGYLTDTIMLISYNHDDKSTSMVSMPRDFWVDYERACAAGYRGKINAIYECYSDSSKNEQAGAEALKKKVAAVFGLDIQYYAHVNFKAVTSLIDAVGGVEIVIESEDPRGIYDPASKHMRYPNGPTGLLNGKEALRLMRARNSKGGYGLPNSNFDREGNQQKVIAALIKKIQSGGVLSDVGKVSNIVDIFEKNVRTDVGANEIQAAINIAKNVDIKNVKSISLITPGELVVTTGNINSQSIVQPQGTSLYDYSKIQSYILRKMTNDKVILEQAKIGVYNATDRSGVAAAVQDDLEQKGFQIIKIGNAEHKSDKKYTIYRLAKDKPATIAKLEQVLTDNSVKNEAPTFNYDLTLDIVVVVNK